jgi:uncharacterized protein (DUF1499 family)
MTPVEFETLTLTRKPNQFLMLPEGFTAAATPHATSPVFPADPPTLAAVLKKTALAEPRTQLLSADENGHRYEFVQRSAVFRFPDYVSVQIVPAGDGRSALAVYSRAKVGHSDFGVNRRRIERWVSALRALLTADA